MLGLRKTKLKWLETNGWIEREVEKINGTLRAITTLSGNRYEGKIFMDCTYEGDLMASAGVPTQLVVKRMQCMGNR